MTIDEINFLINDEYKSVVYKISMLAMMEDSKLPLNVNLAAEELKDFIWVTSLIASSDDENHKNIANSIGAMFCKIKEYDGVNLQSVGKLFISRSGNIPVADLLIANGVEEEFSGISLEFVKNKIRNVIKTDNEEDPFVWGTSFQCELNKKLNGEDQVFSISAPTSAGKSFIVQMKLLKRIKKEKNINVLYVVPTKTLLNQAANSFRSKVSLDEVNVLTHYNDELEFEEGKSNVFVLTPERSLSLIADENRPLVNQVFIDEVQNVTQGNRGVILEYIISESRALWPGAEYITAGPYIDDKESALKLISDEMPVSIETSFEPIYQVRVNLKLRSRKTEVNGEIIHNNIGRIKFQSDIGGKYYSQSKINLLSKVLLLFDKGMTLIYNSRKDYAENRAVKLEENIKKDTTISENVESFIEFLSEEVHPKYRLIKSLKKSIAFHHSGLPEIVRSELEYLIEKNEIKYVFCTSTLLEGVNFPASRMVLVDAKTNNTALSKFAFMNLAGRAGRISSNYIGYLYCFEKEGEEWSEEYLSSKELKKIKLASSVVIEKEIDQLDKLFLKDSRELEVEDEDDLKTLKNTMIFLRNVYIVNNVEFEKILSRKIKDSEKRMLVHNALAQSVENIESIVSMDLMKRNPFVDPLLLKKLILLIREEGVQNWIISSKQFSSVEGLTKEEQRNSQFTNKNFYFQFESIIERLDGVFGIYEEIKLNTGQWPPTLRSIVRTAVHWLMGDTLKQIITTEIAKSSNKDADFVIRETTKRINQYVTFFFARYISILSQVLESELTDKQKEDHKFALSLGTMLELGSIDGITLQMITAGIPRTIAISVRKQMPKKFEGDFFKELKKIAKRGKISPIYLRYLERYGFI